MSQIALPLDACPDARPFLNEAVSPHPYAEPQGFEAEGYRIGWEHARYQTTPPADHLHAGHPVRQGWEAGRAAFAGRARAANRATRLWLELRLQAWVRGRAFDELMVTPRFVAQIDVPVCPVQQQPLSHGVMGGRALTDAVVMVLYEGAGCAAGNLAVVSRRAAQARAALTGREMAELMRRLEAGEVEEVAGLDLPAWRRLAALASLATPPGRAGSSELAAPQPMHVLPPPRVCLLHPLQGLQALLTLVFTAPAYARALTDLGALMPHAQARRAYFLFMSALLARRLSARGTVSREQVRAAMEQAWSHPLVQQRWAALAQTLKPAQAERVLRVAAQRSAGVPGLAWRWTDEAAATEGWALDTQGRVDGDMPAQPVSAPAAAPVSRPTRPQPLHPWAGGAAPRGAAGRPTAPTRRPARGTA
jgi:hypothetical protein